MSLTGHGLANFGLSKIGTPYVYGMKGQVLTKAKFIELQKMYGVSYVWNSDSKKIGKVCCDCSGLISWYTNKMLGSSQLYADAVKRQSISTIDEAPIGATVWKQGHVGIFIGYENGVPMYVAEDGSAYGCRKNKLSNAKFTHWLLQSYITYDMSTSKKNKDTAKPSIKYKGHCENLGDTSVVKDGKVCGTTGRALRLEALSIVGLDNAPGVGIAGQAHVQSIGWQNQVIFGNGNYIGTKGRKVRMDAIKFSLCGSNADKYVLKYRVHMQGIGWGTWVTNGNVAGTTGQKRRIEAVQIKILKK